MVNKIMCSLAGIFTSEGLKRNISKVCEPRCMETIDRTCQSFQVCKPFSSTHQASTSIHRNRVEIVILQKLPLEVEYGLKKH